MISNSSKSQLFKTSIPSNILFDLLKYISVYNDHYYTINRASFKKGQFNGLIDKFIDICKPFYHKSKHKYFDNPFLYNSFITVVRHICKLNNITYKSALFFDSSKYEIEYFIYPRMELSSPGPS
jgi:hypothetical protein